MKKAHYSITINADRERVWNMMLDPDIYRTWTTPFAEGSYFEGSWNKGERILFLTPDGAGMLSVIAENRPHEFLSIEHIGFIKDGVEDTESEAVRSWAPAFEDYSLLEAGGATELRIEMDVTPEYEEFMQQAWPKALAKLKEICEAR
jgi:uncharacterized protein YndB with AHSA1/START domain